MYSFLKHVIEREAFVRKGRQLLHKCFVGKYFLQTELFSPILNGFTLQRWCTGLNTLTLMLWYNMCKKVIYGSICNWDVYVYYSIFIYPISGNI